MDVWLNYYKFQFRFISPTGAQYKMVTVVGKEIWDLNFVRIATQVCSADKQ